MNWAAVKKLALGTLALVLLVIGMFWIWVQFPTSKYDQLLQEQRREVTQRHDALQAQAKNPESNGYLDPVFLPFWGSEDTRQASAAVNQKITAWTEFSSLKRGQTVDHAGLVNEPSYLETRKDFEELLPGLHQALERPVFTVPGTQPTLFRQRLGLTAMRSLAFALSALAEAQVSQGEMGEASRSLLLMYRLGHHVSSQGDPAQLAVGRVFQREACRSLLNTVPTTSLSVDLAQEWASELESFPPTNLLARAAAYEMVALSETLKVSSSRQGMMTSWHYRLPGMMAREERICFNLMGESVSSLQSGNSLPRPPSGGLGDWLAGRSGDLSTIWIPQFDRLQLQLEYSEKLCQGVRLSCGLLAEHSRTGAWPKDLPDNEAQWDHAKQQLFVPLPTQLMARCQRDGIAKAGTEAGSWMTVKSDGLLFNL